MKGWLSQRAVTIDALSMSPPGFNPNRGPVRTGFELKINTERGNIYDTLNGTDPRLFGGSISPTPFPIMTESMLLVDAPTQAIPTQAIDASIRTQWTLETFVEETAGQVWVPGKTGVSYDTRSRYAP